MEPNEKIISELISEYQNKLFNKGFMTLTFAIKHETDSDGIVVASNCHPYEFINPLTSFLVDVTSDRAKDPNGKLQSQDFMVNTLVHSVLGYFDKMKFLEKQSKYKKFLSGDKDSIESLTDEEVDEFIDIKLKESQRKESKVTPLIYRTNARSHILYSSEQELLYLLICELRLTEFKMAKLKSNLEEYPNLDHLYSITSTKSKELNPEAILKAIRKLKLEGVNLIDYHSHEIYDETDPI